MLLILSWSDAEEEISELVVERILVFFLFVYLTHLSKFPVHGLDVFVSVILWAGKSR
jgi:hypothetical protein